MPPDPLPEALDLLRAHLPATAGAPLSQAEVNAAIDDVISRTDLLGAVQLAPHVLKLPGYAQVEIKTKVRVHFKRDSGLFDEALRKASRDAKDVDEPPEGPERPRAADGSPDLINFPFTDSGNGERMAVLYAGEIHYCIEMKSWIYWSGRQWLVDNKRVVTQKSKKMARLLYAQAADISDKGFRSKVESWARQSESHAGITRTLERAASEDGISISAAELDQHPYLLNCANGVVDLRTGQLMPHDRVYLITKICNVEYHPEAKCPKLKKFLQWAMGQNPDAEISERTTRLVRFLQRLFGYALTADVSEKCVFVFWGPKGNNGKTTLLTLFRELLPDYSTQISIDTLMSSRNQDATLRADLADLRGARLVVTSEVEKQSRLSVGKLKYVTAGMGKIKSCKKWENPIEFEATHKLIMDCNWRPNVSDPDDAIWGRLIPIPFEVRIEKTDADYDAKLKEKLLQEGEGILAWMVRGCVRWMQGGLDAPVEISAANEDWRQHDDPLREFIEDCCEVDTETPDPDYGAGRKVWVRSPELMKAYDWWSRSRRNKWTMGHGDVVDLLRHKGIETKRGRRDAEGTQMRTMEGVRVRDEISKQIGQEGRTYQPPLSS